MVVHVGRRRGRAGQREARPTICWLLLIACGLIAPLRCAATEAVNFRQQIQPILSRRCVKCHGGVKRESGLSFVDRRGATKPADSGEIPIVPGDPQRSALLARVTAADGAERMPPVGEPLAAAEVDLLRRWIAEGAEWPAHWSFSPPRLPDFPAVADRQWPRTAIDFFVLAKLEHAGIRPSPEADRPALIRRLYLDLLGLPPTPAEVAAFGADEADDAYERLVERLLASPHFGERWGRHWLDLARYADTDGYEVDSPRPTAWYWRDWVLAAVNDDMPFDRFTVEQLAGDLLPDATQAQRIATGFHRQTLTNKESGVDQEEYRTYALVDRVSTTGLVWLGLTLGCTQCHDHPYDALSQEEFYQLFAFFNDADEGDLELPRPVETAAAAERPARGGRRRPTQLLLPVLVQRPEPRTTWLLRRGNFQQPVQDHEIQPGAPAALPALTCEAPGERPSRLDLARWLVAAENPLTARVAANRIWQHLFGEGLVRTPGDFGSQGEPPTHPELLDWLAEEYQRLAWSNKSLIRRIVMSATYRQASAYRPELQESDADNRFLHRQNRFRVEAEIVHDLGLAVSGQLSSKLGGPSVYPPFPESLAQVDFRSDLRWTTSRGEDRYRRGMYTFFKRTLPHPNLVEFDCPDGNATLVQRSRSNTPLQALLTLNNVIFVDAARALGQRLLQTGATGDGQRIEDAWQVCLSRQPTQYELQRAQRLLADLRAWYRSDGAAANQLAGQPAGEDAVEMAVWTALANILLNLDEFITRS